MKTISLVLSALLSLAAPIALAQDAEWRPQVLIVDAMDDARAWIDMPDTRRGPDTGRMRDVPTGLRVQFPIVVSNLPALPGRGLSLEADIEFLGPQGQVLWSRKACCRKTVRDSAAGQAVVLEPAASVQFEPNDTAGTYSVRATVSDGQRTATATETFRFGEAKREAGAMRLQMNAPKKNPGVDRDARDCLALPTPSEVIKCTERKK